MSSRCLLVIDVQNDFVTGSLGTPEAREMLPRLLEKVQAFDGCVMLTKDTHQADYADTQEGRMLPVVHCVRGTAGWAFPAALETLCAQRHFPIFEKPTFGSIRLAEELHRQSEAGTLEAVELVGLCTDICVISNALLLKAMMPELPLFVDASCCAGVTPEKHRAALDVMRSCQIIVQ